MRTLCQRRIPAGFDPRIGWIDILTFRRIKTASRAQQSLSAKRKRASFSQTYPPPTGILQKPFKLVEPASRLGHLSRKTGLDNNRKANRTRREHWGSILGGGLPICASSRRADSREAVKLSQGEIESNAPFSFRPNPGNLLFYLLELLFYFLRAQKPIAATQRLGVRSCHYFKAYGLRAVQQEIAE